MTDTSYKKEEFVIYYPLKRITDNLYVMTFDLNKYKEMILREEIRKRLQG